MRNCKRVDFEAIAVQLTWYIERLTEYINENGPRQFDSPLELVKYIDELHATND